MYRRVIKRMLDFVIALFFLPLFGMIFIIVAPFIYGTDRGPVFYNALRMGVNGKKFKMHKFRTMSMNAPDIRNKDGSTFNGENDPRVTKIGRVLRKTSLDETAQILNVLRGEMSFVGPRAFVTNENEDFGQLDEERKKRLSVRPGITGYSQAYYRNSIGLDQKIKYDCDYVDQISFAFDVKIMIKTVTTVLMHKNIYVKPDVPIHTEEKSE